MNGDESMHPAHPLTFPVETRSFHTLREVLGRSFVLPSDSKELFLNISQTCLMLREIIFTLDPDGSKLDLYADILDIELFDERNRPRLEEMIHNAWMTATQITGVRAPTMGTVPLRTQISSMCTDPALGFSAQQQKAFAWTTDRLLRLIDVLALEVTIREKLLKEREERFPSS